MRPHPQLLRWCNGGILWGVIIHCRTRLVFFPFHKQTAKCGNCKRCEQHHDEARDKWSHWTYSNLLNVINTGMLTKIKRKEKIALKASFLVILLNESIVNHDMRIIFISTEKQAHPVTSRCKCINFKDVCIGLRIMAQQIFTIRFIF